MKRFVVLSEPGTGTTSTHSAFDNLVEAKAEATRRVLEKREVHYIAEIQYVCTLDVSVYKF